jgi:hypothetical protein
MTAFDPKADMMLEIFPKLISRCPGGLQSDVTNA